MCLFIWLLFGKWRKNGCYIITYLALFEKPGKTGPSAIIKLRKICKSIIRISTKKGHALSRVTNMGSNPKFLTWNQVAS